MSERTFAKMVEAARNSTGLSTADFCSNARTATKTYFEIVSGNWERSVGLVENKTRRKLHARSHVVVRICRYCGEDPEPWLKKLGLPDVGLTQNRKPENEFIGISKSVLTQDDIQVLERASETLGELLTVEIAIGILHRKHTKPPSV